MAIKKLSAMFIELGDFGYRSQQRDRFVSGELWKQWAKGYPDIFDEEDVRIAKSQAGPKMRQHFHEWLAAVLIFHTYGYLSLIEQYEFKKHKRKQAVAKPLLGDEVFKFVTDHKERFDGVQCPDLLSYSPDYSDWFFCEVKGPGDDFQASQLRFFEELAQISGKRIRVMCFQTAQL
jgi:hypothetical protein